MTTKHATDGTCGLRFGKVHGPHSCARCTELENGSPARAGWQTEHFARKARESAQLTAELAAHYGNGGKCSCGPVCTRFDP